MKKLLLSLLGFAAVAGVTAQEHPKNIVGVRAGYDVSWVTTRGVSASVKHGYVAGITDQVLLSRKVPFYFETGLNFIAKGYEINGYDGFVMINLYPQRSKYPWNLEKEFNIERHKNNLAEIARIAKELKFDTVLAAWGDNIKTRKYLKVCLKDIAATLSEHTLEWKCIAMTVSKQPWHPSRAAYGKFKDFDIAAAISR